MKSLTAGAPAPDFTLEDENRQPVTLSKVIGKQIIVLFFYPRDHSPGCTAEACAFRDAYQDFTGAGARVIGISADNGATHLTFIAANRLNFNLLSAVCDEFRKLYGVKADLFGLFPGRVTFVIDKKGKVRGIFRSQIRFRQHVLEALQMIHQLKNEEPHEE